MAEKKIQARIRQKVDTKANWDKATNFVPLKGEVIIYSDLNQAKIGDGVTKVSALPFLKGKADATDKNPTLAWGSKSTVATVDGIDLHVTMPSNPNTHQSVTDKNPTLTWGGKSTVATIGSTDIHVTMPGNPDTHLTTGLYVGKASEKSNSATTNGNTYLKLFDNDTKRSQHLIHGTGLTTVASDASGTITINSTLPTNLVTTDTEQTVTGTKHFNAITANTIGTGSDANNYFQSQKFRGEGDANTYYHAVDFGYANHDQVDFYEYGGVWNFYRNRQADTSAKELLFGINPSGIKLPTVTGVKVLGTNADGQVESHTLGIADISSLQSTLDSKVNSSSLATVAKTGSYNDLSNKPTNHATTEQLANKLDKNNASGTGSFTWTNTEKGKPLDIKFVATTDQSGVDIMGFNATDTLATLTGSAYMGNTKFTLQSGYSDGDGPSIVIDNNGYKTTITANGINPGDNGNIQWPTSGGRFVTSGDFANENATDPSANQGKIPKLEYPGTIPLKFIKPMVSMYASENDLPGAVHFSPYYVPDALYVTTDTNSIYRYNKDTESYVKLGPDTSKFLDKGTSSTVVNQVVYNPVEMKKALTVPSLTVSDIKNAAMVSTDANGKLTKSNLPAAFEQISVIDKTIQYNDNIEVTEVYLSCEGMEDHYAWDRLVFSAPGSPAASNIKYYYNYMGQKTELTPTNASALNSSIASSGESIAVAINRNESNPTITYLPNGLVLGGGYYSNKEGGDVFTYYVYDAPQGYMPAIREIAPDTSTTQQWKLTSTSGTVTTVNICTK